MMKLRSWTFHGIIKWLTFHSIIKWLMYLFSNCPPTLTSLIAREVYDEAKKLDFSEYEEKGQESEEIQGEDEKEKSWTEEEPLPGTCLVILDIT